MHQYLLDCTLSTISLQGLDGDNLWSSISNNLLMSIVFTLKHCSFTVKGKVSRSSFLAFTYSVGW